MGLDQHATNMGLDLQILSVNHGMMPATKMMLVWGRHKFHPCIQLYKYPKINIKHSRYHENDMKGGAWGGGHHIYVYIYNTIQYNII